MMNLYYEYNNKDSDSTFVFLHGWGLNSNSFNSIINCLKDISILKVDFYGFGKSDKPREYFDTYEYAYQIFLLLKKLCIKNVILIGHSFGGRIAIILSSVFKINIKFLVLTSSAGINKFSIKTWCKIRWYKLLKLLYKWKIITGRKVDNYGSIDYKNLDVLMRKIFVKVVNQDLRFLLKNISAKTFLVWDKKDKDTPYYIARILSEKISNAKIVLYNRGGHFTAFKNVNKFSNLLNCIIVNV